VKKFERLAFKLIDQAGCKVLTRKKIGGHIRLIVQLPSGEQSKLILASSPTCAEHALHAVRREIEGLLGSSSPNPA
jgi:hypothetical protein